MGNANDARVEIADPMLRSIADSSPDSIMLLDLEGRIRFVNRTAPGLTVAGVLGTSVFDYMPLAAQATARAAFRRVISSSEPDYYESPFIGEDGSLYVWEARVSAVKRDGEVEALVVIATDVTERRRDDAERQRFFALSMDMLVSADRGGYFRRVNPAGERILGYSAAELGERPFIDFVHPDDQEVTRAAFQRLLDGERVIDFENRYRHKAGGYRTLEWRATPDPETQLVYAVARDVTEQRLLDEHLQQTQKVDLVGQLAGGVAHDFNNLVLALTVNAEFLDELVPHSQQRARRYLGEIQRAADRAGALTKQLLAFSRQQQHSPRRLDLDALLADLVDLLRRLIPESIEIELATQAKDDAIHADHTQIEQVVINLCVNARDAIGEGGGRISITTEAAVVDDDHPWAPAGHYVVLAIRDTGCGMTSEVRERAFEPFFTTKPVGRGTGLGLATVYGVARRHDGAVQIDSTPGEGTTVSVYLPVAEQADDKVAPEVSAKPPGGDEVVLVAEDEAQVRMVVVQLLERAGYTVLAAADGAEALELLEQNAERVSLMMLDVVMPELSGPETFVRVRSTHPDLPVVMTSGYRDPARFAGQLPAEVPVLTKPYRSEVLLRVVRAAIDARERRGDGSTNRAAAGRKQAQSS